MADIDCVWCANRHDSRYLCDELAEPIARMAQKAAGYNIPTVVFDEPIYQPADGLLRGLTVAAGIIEMGAAHWPTLVLTGNSATTGEALGPWTYCGTVDDIRRTRQLFSRMADLAIHRATEANRGGAK